MILTLDNTAKYDFFTMGAMKIPGTETCKSDFWSRTCCWAEQGPSSVARVCETCLDNGDGTYRDCKIHPERSEPQNKPSEPLSPPKGGIFQGDIIPKSGPATQDSPNDNQGGPAPGGVLQPNLEFSTQNRGTTAQDVQTQQQLAINESPSADVDEESIQSCPEDQVFDKDTNNCIAEGPQSNEQDGTGEQGQVSNQ